MPVDVSSFLLSVWGLSIPEGGPPTRGFVYVKEFELIAEIFEAFSQHDYCTIHIEIKLKTELSLEKLAMEFLSCSPDFIVIFKRTSVQRSLLVC